MSQRDTLTSLACQTAAPETTQGRGARRKAAAGDTAAPAQRGKSKGQRSSGRDRGERRRTRTRTGFTAFSQRDRGRTHSGQENPRRPRAWDPSLSPSWDSLGSTIHPRGSKAGEGRSLIRVNGFNHLICIPFHQFVSQGRSIK